MEDGKFIKISQAIVCALLIVSVALNIHLLTRENDERVVEKVKVEVVRDTVRDTVPIVKTEKLVSLRRDTMVVVDTIQGDTVSVVVEVPITQKEYTDDSTYTAWVSGYRQKLDSISVYRKNVYITRDIVKTKRQRIVFGPYVGYGYDFNGRKAGVSVGVGVTYNVFGF
jgi:hypothetical protein